MRVIIAGSRNCKDEDKVFSEIWEFLDSGETITEVVCGGATGVDSIGATWATCNDIPIKRFPAEWGKYGRAAGPIRNRKMAQYADGLILIWNGKSRGSASMLREAEEAGLQVIWNSRDLPE